MRYIFYLIGFLELFIALALFKGDEYPENIFATFILFFLIFAIFLSALKYSNGYYKIIKGLTWLNILILFSWLLWILYQGHDYFFWSWKGMTLSQYRTTVILASIAVVFQVVILFLVNKKNRTH